MRVAGLRPDQRIWAVNGHQRHTTGPGSSETAATVVPGQRRNETDRRAHSGIQPNNLNMITSKNTSHLGDNRRMVMMSKPASVPVAPGWRGRLAAIGFGLGAWLVALVLLGGIATVRHLYHGEIDLSSASRTAGVASVSTCSRVGPVSVHGFGYWWNCDVVVALADGRAVETRVDASIVTPADRGHPVRIVEVCDEAGHRECVYSRDGSALVGYGVLVLGLVFRIVLVAGLFIGGVALLRGGLGPQRLHRYFAKRRGPAAGADPTAGASPAGDDEFSMARFAVALVLGYGVLYVIVRLVWHGPMMFG